MDQLVIENLELKLPANFHCARFPVFGKRIVNGNNQEMTDFLRMRYQLSFSYEALPEELLPGFSALFGQKPVLLVTFPEAGGNLVTRHFRHSGLKPALSYVDEEGGAVWEGFSSVLTEV
ncbi:MAG: hypothetical protein FWE85_04885 [Clostridiales bacterium]|nr:hypothetical protein [Clostridiales bacterium]